ncbi:hypothetical protein [Flavobacterium sp. UBA6135]|uniref:hypothetical protein n=1 Tax=Flavobacterium sp. UBA6135 TaxID=1946553 RepID=UPI0025C515B9|nr:hypothetical protein [Flavobacterium sp. UBA6135]
MKFFLATIVSFFSSIAICQKVDIEFKIENQNSLIEYLDKKKVDYTLDDVAILKDIKVFGDYGKTERLVVPEAYFFNKEGFLIKNKKKGISCGATIKDLSKILKSKYDSNQKITTWMNDFKILGKNDLLSEDYDIYILINWAIFLDSNNEISFNWYKSLKSNKDLKIKVILINLDVQESWNLTEGQKIFLGV